MTLPDVKDLIREALAKHINDLTEEEIKDAVSSYEKKLRAAVGRVALSVLDHYSIERWGNDIRITVQVNKQ